jgi:2-C-methyl-D-erythritol 4-phosphate cytidylyltransferase
MIPLTKTSYCNILIKKNQIKILTGGSTRFESVKKGLDALPNDGIVFIHDAVRPFITKSLLDELLNTAIEKGNAIPCIDVNDSMRKINENGNHAVDRTQYKSIQTPQVFQLDLIKKGLSTGFKHLIYRRCFCIGKLRRFHTFNTR